MVPDPRRSGVRVVRVVRGDMSTESLLAGRQGVPADRGTGRDSLRATTVHNLGLVSGGNDIRGEIRQFLTTRRAKITPEQAGLANYGGKRRVPGLRREEVALLAGISIEYYKRLERGNATGVSDDVLDALARALQLDDIERAHLIDLVRAANARRPVRRPPTRQLVRPSVQHILDSMTAIAAFLRNGRLDILSANQLGYALYAPALLDPSRPVNLARFIFLDRRSTEFYRDWDGIAHAAVGSLRAEAGRDPYNRALTDLVGELSTRSAEFRVRWAAHNVRYYRSGIQPFHHPVVGDLTLNYDALEIPADPGLTIVAHSADPGSPSQPALDPARQLDLAGRSACHPIRPPHLSAGTPRPSAAPAGRQPCPSSQSSQPQRDLPTGSPATSTSTASSAAKSRRACRSVRSGLPPLLAPHGTYTPSARRFTSPKARACTSPVAVRSRRSAPVTSSTRRLTSGTGTAPHPSTS